MSKMKKLEALRHCIGRHLARVIKADDDVTYDPATGRVSDDFGTIVSLRPWHGRIRMTFYPQDTQFRSKQRRIVTGPKDAEAKLPAIF